MEFAAIITAVQSATTTVKAIESLYNAMHPDKQVQAVEVVEKLTALATDLANQARDAEGFFKQENETIVRNQLTDLQAANDALMAKVDAS